MERITVDFANGEQLKFDVPNRLLPKHTFAIRQHSMDRDTYVICVRAWPSSDASEDRNEWAISQGITIITANEQPSTPIIEEPVQVENTDAINTKEAVVAEITEVTDSMEDEVTGSMEDEVTGSMEDEAILASPETTKANSDTVVAESFETTVTEVSAESDTESGSVPKTTSKKRTSKTKVAKESPEEGDTDFNF